MDTAFIVAFWPFCYLRQLRKKLRTCVAFCLLRLMETKLYVRCGLTSVISLVCCL